MSRIRSNKYITKIYNSSYSTNYTSILINKLCNITKVYLTSYYNRTSSLTFLTCNP